MWVDLISAVLVSLKQSLPTTQRKRIITESIQHKQGVCCVWFMAHKVSAAVLKGYDDSSGDSVASCRNGAMLPEDGAASPTKHVLLIIYLTG